MFCFYCCCSCPQAHYSTGRVCASFTSTAMTPVTTHEAGKWTPHMHNRKLHRQKHLSQTPQTSSWFFFLLWSLFIKKRHAPHTCSFAVRTVECGCKYWAAAFSCVSFPCLPLCRSMGEIWCYATVKCCRVNTLQTGRTVSGFHDLVHLSRKIFTDKPDLPLLRSIDMTKKSKLVFFIL